jgi:uncharacterized sulfatase
MREESPLTRRTFLKRGAAVALAAGATVTLGSLPGGRAALCLDEAVSAAAEGVRSLSPNIIIINADDLGYGDLGCYGGTAIRTPNIDRLASEGVRFTDFCSCNAVCSPSRFGLLTGRYPQRAGLYGVLFPENEPFKEKALKVLGRIGGKIGMVDFGSPSTVKGIPADEITLPEALKKQGYRTGMVGKWHLGDFVALPEYNPTNHGFDSFFGVPYSNDMHPYPLCRDQGVVEEDIEDQSKLTGLYTREAAEFIETSVGNPFFLYFAHTFPHQPLNASGDFYGKSVGGRYGDTVEEIDWSVGELLSCLATNGLDRDTLVFFTSDNGPWYNGSPGGLRGRKGQSFEGGFRVPLIARWPGRFPKGSVRREPAMNIDLLPTCLTIAGAELPSDRIIDGKSLDGLLAGTSTTPPHETLYFYHYDRIEGIRAGKWKLYREINTFVHPVPMDKVLPSAGYGPPWLYDLEADPGESYNLASNYPDVVRQLSALIDEREQQMKENPRGWNK